MKKIVPRPSKVEMEFTEGLPEGVQRLDHPVRGGGQAWAFPVVVAGGL